MSSQPASPQFLSCLSPACRDKLQIRNQSRVASLEAHQRLLSDAAAGDQELSSKDFIKSRFEVLDIQIRECSEYLDGLSRLSEEGFPGVQLERARYINHMKPLVQEHKILKRSARGLLDDICDELIVSKRRKPNDPGNEAEAFANSLSQLFRSAAKQKKSRFDASKFKKDVVRYLGAGSEEKGSPLLFCHLTGLWLASRVKAAHIIPKMLDDDVVEHLFGSDERQARTNPRNALLLYSVIEKAFDQGDIAIVPMTAKDNEPTMWKCIVINESIMGNMIAETSLRSPGFMRFKDIHNRPLEFLNDNRPAKRFLYLRFVMTLIQAKKNGMEDIIAKLELGGEAKCFWPSPGEYLRKSTLQAVTRRISGLELPESVVDTTTFEDDDPVADNDIMDAESTVNVHHATN